MGSLLLPTHLVGCELPKVLEKPPCFSRIQGADGDPRVDDDKISHPRLGHAGQADAPPDAGELDQAVRQLLVRTLALDDFSRNA
jgi:hypothetical protein